MKILLPPSETKTQPATKVFLDWDALPFSELNEGRKLLLTNLVAVSRRPDALSVLKFGKSIAGQVAANVTLLNNPACPVSELYQGVLFDALDYVNLPKARRDPEQLLVQSALWGLLDFSAVVPPYRLKGGTNLPGFGKVSAFWRPLVAPFLDQVAENELVIDCRSSEYSAFWRPRGAAALGNYFVVKVVNDLAAVKNSVSHAAKHTRGLVANKLCGHVFRTPDEVETHLKQWFNLRAEPGLLTVEQPR